MNGCRDCAMYTAGCPKHRDSLIVIHDEVHRPSEDGLRRQNRQLQRVIDELRAEVWRLGGNPDALWGP